MPLSSGGPTRGQGCAGRASLLTWCREMENTKGDTEKEVQVSPWRKVISLFIQVLSTNHK